MQRLATQCSGSGGVLDSLLDIVGQCTPSTKTGNTPADAAGCGVADAKKIRSNCCSLISLLVALLAGSGSESNVTGKYGAVSSGPDKDKRSSQEDENAPLLPGAPPSCREFVQMSAVPNPSAVDALPKKGWAARQALLRPAGSTVPSSNSRIRTRATGYTDVKLRQRRVQEGGERHGQSTTDQANTAAHLKTMGGVFLAARNAELIPLEAQRKGETGRRGYTTANSAAAAVTPNNGRVGVHHRPTKHTFGLGMGGDELNGTRTTSPSLETLPEPFASPPRLGRARGTNHSKAFHPPANAGRRTQRYQYFQEREGDHSDGDVPLGLSSPELGRRKITPKVTNLNNPQQTSNPAVERLALTIPGLPLTILVAPARSVHAPTDQHQHITACDNMIEWHMKEIIRCLRAIESP